MKNSKFKEERRPKRPLRSETFAALKLLQNCSLFDVEQVVLHLQSHLDKFSLLYEKILQSKKQQTEIYFSHRYKLGNFFLKHKTIEK